MKDRPRILQLEVFNKEEGEKIVQKEQQLKAGNKTCLQAVISADDGLIES